MIKIYESWLKRTKHIDYDCDYCGNERYEITSPILTVRDKN